MPLFIDPYLIVLAALVTFASAIAFEMSGTRATLATAGGLTLVIALYLGLAATVVVALLALATYGLARSFSQLSSAR